MTAHSRSSSKKHASPLSAAVTFAPLLAGGWIWLVAGTHLDEMIVGCAVVVVATLFLVAAYKSKRDAFDLNASDLKQCWRIPWYLVSGMWEITLVLVKDLLYLHRAGSYYRVCGFKSSKRDLKVAGREVLATVYTTVAPNFIVIGIDPDLSRMLFHQIERSSIPKMTQALGAQS